MLVFENRGPEVGSTITHPHGQIYAFGFVPELPLRELERGAPFTEPGDRLVATAPGWRAWVPEAPTFPYALLVAPDDDVPDLPSLDRGGRRALARLLVDVLERLDRLFRAQTPYMLWIHQRPFDGGDWPDARLHVEIVSPWRAAGRAALRRGRRARLGRLLQPGGARGRGAGAARGTPVNALETLLRHGGGRSWESPELTSLDRVPPSATLERARRAAARRHLGVRARSPAPRTRRPQRAGARPRCPACGRCRASPRRSTRTSRCRSTSGRRRCPRPTRPASTGAGSTVPDEWRDRRVVLHFGGSEGALYVTVNGEPVGIAKDSRTPAEFDVTERRARRRRERAGRRRRPVVGRELRRGPGPVVARRPAARRCCSTRRRAAYVADVFARGDMDGRPRRRRADGRAGRGARGAARSRRERRARRAARGRPARARRSTRRGCGRPSGRTSTRSSSPLGDGRVVRAASASAASRSPDRQLLVNGRAGADLRRQPPRPRRPPRPRGHARADGGRRAADEAVQRQRRALLALPERPVLARPVRPRSACT